MRFWLYVILIIFLSSCNSENGTPAQYKYKITISKIEYKLDSAKIMNKLTYMLKKNVHPFTPAKQFDRNTQLFLDSIIYSPDKNKMIALVISKNSNSKLEQPLNYKTNFHYNGNYLYCKKVTSNNDIIVSDYSSFNLIHWETYNDVKERLKEECFEVRYQLGIRDKKPIYNLDDKRFWESLDYNSIMDEKYDYRSY